MDTPAGTASSGTQSIVCVSEPAEHGAAGERRTLEPGTKIESVAQLVILVCQGGESVRAWHTGPPRGRAAGPRESGGTGGGGSEGVGGGGEGGGGAGGGRAARA